MAWMHFPHDVQVSMQAWSNYQPTPFVLNLCGQYMITLPYFKPVSMHPISSQPAWANVPWRQAPRLQKCLQAPLQPTKTLATLPTKTLASRRYTHQLFLFYLDLDPLWWCISYITTSVLNHGTHVHACLFMAEWQDETAIRGRQNTWLARKKGSSLGHGIQAFALLYPIFSMGWKHILFFF